MSLSQEDKTVQVRLEFKNCLERVVLHLFARLNAPLSLYSHSVKSLLIPYTMHRADALFIDLLSKLTIKKIIM